jgi:coenzyme PQQ precursor peptide PqqA
MTWNTPVVVEVAVGMEVTSYESAEIDTFNGVDETALADGGTVFVREGVSY